MKKLITAEDVRRMSDDELERVLAEALGPVVARWWRWRATRDPAIAAEFADVQTSAAFRHSGARDRAS